MPIDVYPVDDLIKHIVRRALSITTDDLELRTIVGTTRFELMKKVVDRITDTLVVEKGNHLRCGLCGKGPFTRRGLFLHLIRVHRSDIIEMVEKKYREVYEETLDDEL